MFHTKQHNKKLKILFISRAYPPIIGGIENQNYELSVWLPKITPTKTIANTHGKKTLPLFLLYILIILPFISHKYDVILLGDGVLGIASWWTKLFHKNKKFACIVHGLDLTYKNNFYQKWWVQKFIPTCDKLIAVGNQTITEGIKRNIDKSLFTFIPNGIHPEKFIHDEISHDEIYNIIGEKYKDKKRILTFGRLAKRKGVAWFIRNVLPKLDNNYIYIVAGDGIDKENVQTAIKEKHLEDRVVLLGIVSDSTRETLFAGSDILVQPNIKVADDMEGFGISVIEAGVSGLPVLAARLEGLKDAITDGKNGILIKSEDAIAWKQKIEEVFDDNFDRKIFGLQARAYIVENLSWRKISRRYLDILSQI
ncbi:MAG: TetR family transcriptional regulator [Candidatus Moraniibacteriota bacterium]|nr:MAG: TetR family transcriptional regulator [Candidatus Moranbacteria bacterium]